MHKKKVRRRGPCGRGTTSDTTKGQKLAPVQNPPPQSAIFDAHSEIARYQEQAETPERIKAFTAGELTKIFPEGVVSKSYR